MKYSGAITLNKVFQLIKNEITKYVSKEDFNDNINLLSHQIRDNEFRGLALMRSCQYGLEYLCIENFKNFNDIDTTKDNWSSITKSGDTSTGYTIENPAGSTNSFQSKSFDVEITPYQAIVLVDCEVGTGASIEVQISKNDGSSWTSITQDTMTDLGTLVQKKIRVRITMVGQVKIHNIAWGIK